jgi:hypothetical protein
MGESDPSPHFLTIDSCYGLTIPFAARSPNLLSSSSSTSPPCPYSASSCIGGGACTGAGATLGGGRTARCVGGGALGLFTAALIPPFGFGAIARALGCGAGAGGGAGGGAVLGGGIGRGGVIGEVGA